MKKLASFGLAMAALAVAAVSAISLSQEREIPPMTVVSLFFSKSYTNPSLYYATFRMALSTGSFLNV